MTARMLGMRSPVKTPKYFGATPASDSPQARANRNNYQVMQCGVGRYFMPAAHLLTDTEKSSVPYKTPLKNHRERTILGVFVKLGVRTLIPKSHILIICLPRNISRPGAFSHQSPPSASSIIPAHPRPAQPSQNKASSSGQTPTSPFKVLIA